nr:hypothetical protein [Escherichia coli]
MAGSLSPSKVSSLNIDPNSTAQYQSPNIGALGALAGAGAAQGGLNRLVDYYTSIAEQQWPIVEISPWAPNYFLLFKKRGDNTYKPDKPLRIIMENNNDNESPKKE